MIKISRISTSDRLTVPPSEAIEFLHRPFNFVRKVLKSDSIS